MRARIQLQDMEDKGPNTANQRVVTDGAGGFTLDPAAGHTTGTLVVYDENSFLGVFEEMRYIGAGVAAYNSGSYVAVAITGTAIELPATGSLTIYDESVLKGQAYGLNFVGQAVEVVISGTIAHVMHTGTGGGGGHLTGTMVIYNESTFLGVFEEMRFIGDGIEAFNSGTYVAVISTGTAAAGGSGVGVPGARSTYLLVGEPEPLDTITGAYWKVPTDSYATGSLNLFIDGLSQLAGTAFTEQHAVSGTFEWQFALPTGVIIEAKWGQPVDQAISTGTITVFDEGVQKGQVYGLNIVGNNVEVVVSGSYAHVMHTGTAIAVPATGSITVFDESVLLGQATAMNFVGSSVEAVMSGTVAHVMHTGSAGGHQTGTMVIYEEGTFLGVFEEMRFIGSHIAAYNSGSYAAIVATGTTVSGGVTTQSGTFQTETVLYETTLVSSTGSVIIPGIPDDYDDLFILINGRTDKAAAGQGYFLYLNGDTTAANYFNNYHAGSVATHTNVEADSALAGVVPSANAPSSEFGINQILIPEYTGGKNKNLSSLVEARLGAGDMRTYQFGYSWESTGTVTRIDLVPDDASNWGVGTYVKVVGRKQTVVVTSVEGGAGAIATGTVVIFDDGALVAGGIGTISFEETLEVSSSGSYAYIKRKQVGARVSKSSDQTISDTTDTAIIFDTEVHDYGACWISSTGTRLTAPIKGVYSVGGNVQFAAGGAATSRQVYVRVNGDSNKRACWEYVQGTNALERIGCSTNYELDEGDYIELMVYQNSGGNLDINANNEAFPHAWLTLLFET